VSQFEELLRKSLEERKHKPLQAVNDLNAIIAEMSQAVEQVTKGRLKLFMDPLKPKENSGPTFAIVLRFAEEDRAIRVIEFAELGYPATVWVTYAGWDSSGVQQYKAMSEKELRLHIQNLIASPTSELVRLIANELAVAEAGSEPALAG